MCAKHYENPTMLSRVTAKNVGDVFLRHIIVVGQGSHVSWKVLGNFSKGFPGPGKSWKLNLKVLKITYGSR